MGRFRRQLFHYPGDLGQLFHQVAAGVQAAGGVRDQHVGAPGLGRLNRVVDHAGGIRTGELGDHRNAVALAPHLQLLHGGGPEGVAGGQHHVLAFGLEAAGQLADGGGLADPVHAHHQNHIGLFGGVDFQRPVHRHQQVAQLFLQRFVERVRVHQFLTADPVGEVADDGVGGFHAHVRHQQLSLDFLEDLVVDLLGAHQQVRQALAQVLAGLAHALLHARPETAVGFGGRPLRRGYRLAGRALGLCRGFRRLGAVRLGFGRLRLLAEHAREQAGLPGAAARFVVTGRAGAVLGRVAIVVA